MGQAKRRGTYEERKAKAIAQKERTQQVENMLARFNQGRTSKAIARLAALTAAIMPVRGE